jgi:hypothetical protein
MFGSLATRTPQLSLASLMATLVATGVHHVFRLGPELIFPVLIALALGGALWHLYRRTDSKGFLIAYAVFAALVVFWFGFLDGFLDHVVKAVGLDNITLLPGSDAEVVSTVFKLWSQEATSAFYEWTGIISAAFALPTLLFTTAFLAERLAPRQPQAAS